MKEIEKVIDLLELKAATHEKTAKAIRESILAVRSLCENEKVTEPITKKTSRRNPAPKAESKRRGSRDPFSQYKGVTKGYIDKEGKIRFQAAYWDGTKNKDLGRFDIEEEAAAHAAMARGETELASELFEIAKEKVAQNNLAVDTFQAMDKPTKRGGQKSKKKRFKCNHCGDEVEHTQQPFQCIKCNSASFKEVPD